MKKKLLFCAFILSCVISALYLINKPMKLHASLLENINTFDEKNDLSYQREMRATWVATVHNLHFPKGLNKEGFVKWADELTSKLVQLNFNTIIFQVRPMGDAVYNSKIVPTSHFVNGFKQGDPIDYDPLELLINISHSKGLEFHAWLNPYRITVANFDLNNLSPDNPAVKNPQWLIESKGQYYLDPGNPEVIEHIADVVSEIVHNYDIDAIHFDDYFYPETNFNDAHTFESFGKGWTNIHDWRRDNVNKLIKLVYDNIKEAKYWVQFGVSPFGIWRNESTDPTGSATSGNQGYDSHYADSREWIRRGIIDYLTPQIYWSKEHTVANYKVLTDWWANQHAYAENTPVNLYIGVADYKVNDNSDKAWSNVMELPTQIKYNRANSLVKGQMHYAAVSVFGNQLGYMDIIKEKLYNTMSLTPSFYWNDSTVPNPPHSVVATILNNGVEINISHEENNVRRYVVYRFEENEQIDYKNKNILGVVFNNSTNVFFDSTALAGKNYFYAVKSISPTGVISEEATVISLSNENVNVEAEYPRLSEVIIDSWYQSNIVFVSVDKEKIKANNHFMILLQDNHIGGIYQGQLYVKEPYRLTHIKYPSNDVIQISATVNGEFILDEGHTLSIQLSTGTPENIGSIVEKIVAYVFYRVN